MNRTFSTTDQQYHENYEFWGEHRFISLENIIDNIKLTSGQDSYFKKMPTHAASIFGKQYVKRSNLYINPKNKAVSFQLGPSLSFPLPRFMMNWHRISMVTENKELLPISIENNPITKDYLQDKNHKLLYDNNGEILRGNDRNYLYKRYNELVFCIDESLIKEKTDYWVKEDKELNKFIFSKSLYDKEIVIEYKSTGLNELSDCDILIYDELELAITYWIQWNIIKSDKNVPLSRIEYYRNLYKIEKRNAKRLLGDKISINQILDSISLKYR